MAQCVVINESGALVASASDPCTGLVVLTPAEYSLMASSPFVLSVEDGALVSGAIGAVWLLAWSLRAIRQVLNPDNSEES